MKHFLLTSLMLLASVCGAKAEVDPNFYIYICFGQSNMEGNAQWESQDVGNVDPRFQMLATCNFSSPKRTLGNWYKAECPIVSPVGKLGPTDYFGRTMVQELPDKKIGVIAVAMGGSPIEMFDKDLYKQKYQDNYNEWWAQIARNYYGENPYGRIIEMAKKAQQVGVIKGILLHQGESNNGDEKWPGMVKKIYRDMLKDLGLRAADVPIFVGETEYENMGGGCSWHNHVVAKIPEVIPTGHVVSAEGIPGNGTDPWHFSAAGYRTFGKRYAEKVLDVMNHPDDYIKHYTIDERLEGGLAALSGKTFAIINEAEDKAFYCLGEQELGYDDCNQALISINEAYQFKTSRVGSGRGLIAVGPDGSEYLVDGEKGHLNSQAVTGECCFINGLGPTGQRGYEIQDGAQWTIEYVEGKGWSLKNVGTGKYLKDATHPAMFDEPTYFTFCTLKEGVYTGITPVRFDYKTANEDFYTLDGRKVSSTSLRPGIYIKAGRKIVIK
jgi:hypothetical protein